MQQQHSSPGMMDNIVLHMGISPKLRLLKTTAAAATLGMMGSS